MMITKETELQEECTELAKSNNQLNEQLATLKEHEAQSCQSVTQIEGQRDQLLSKIKQLEQKDEKRELYISGLEKEVRTLKEENDRMRSNANHNDRESYLKLQDLERDLLLLSDQNQQLSKSLQEKEICLATLEKSYNEIRSMVQQNPHESQRMVTPNFGDNLQSQKMFRFRNKSADIVYPQEG